MAVTTTAIAATTGILSAGASISEGYSKRRTAEMNARVYDAQAQQALANMQIMERQYGAKKKSLEGYSVATAAASGLKVQGSTAQVISNSIAQLSIDESIERYNYNIERNKARQNAYIQRKQGKDAVTQGWMKAGLSLGNTALGMANPGTSLFGGSTAGMRASGGLSGDPLNSYMFA